ncbi:MAG: methionyl-tRNA formyltransferase, partial [Saprospiraceae bacterium]
VINGKSQTGVTSFFLKHKIDTGDILLSQTMEIGPEETTGNVHDRMMELGAEGVLKSVQRIETGDYKLTPQDASKVSKAPKLFKETCEIDFTKSARELKNFVRGLNPYPLAWTTLDGQEVKILKADVTYDVHSHELGTVHTDYKSYLRYAIDVGYLEVLELKPAGKRAMGVKDFLNGYKG